MEIKRTEMQDGEPLADTVEYMEAPFCPLPILLNSKYCYMRTVNTSELKMHRIRQDECPYDEGGYFIINGSEKTLIATEVNRSNRMTVLPGDPDKKELVSAKLVSSVPERALYCKIDLKLVQMDVDGQKQPILMLKMPGFDTPVHCLQVMMALFEGEEFTD